MPVSIFHQHEDVFKIIYFNDLGDIERSLLLQLNTKVTELFLKIALQSTMHLRSLTDIFIKIYEVQRDTDKTTPIKKIKEKILFPTSLPAIDEQYFQIIKELEFWISPLSIMERKMLQDIFSLEIDGQAKDDLISALNIPDISHVQLCEMLRYGVEFAVERKFYDLKSELAAIQKKIIPMGAKYEMNAVEYYQAVSDMTFAINSKLKDQYIIDSDSKKAYAPIPLLMKIFPENNAKILLNQCFKHQRLSKKERFQSLNDEASNQPEGINDGIPIEDVSSPLEYLVKPMEYVGNYPQSFDDALFLTKRNQDGLAMQFALKLVRKQFESDKHFFDQMSLIKQEFLLEGVDLEGVDMEKIDISHDKIFVQGLERLKLRISSLMKEIASNGHSIWAIKFSEKLINYLENIFLNWDLEYGTKCMTQKQLEYQARSIAAFKNDFKDLMYASIASGSSCDFALTLINNINEGLRLPVIISLIKNSKDAESIAPCMLYLKKYKYGLQEVTYELIERKFYDEALRLWGQSKIRFNNIGPTKFEQLVRFTITSQQPEIGLKLLAALEMGATSEAKNLKEKTALGFAIAFAKKGDFENAEVAINNANEAMKPLIRTSIERIRKS